VGLRVIKLVLVLCTPAIYASALLTQVRTLVSSY